MYPSVRRGNAAGVLSAAGFLHSNQFQKRKVITMVRKVCCCLVSTMCGCGLYVVGAELPVSVTADFNAAVQFDTSGYSNPVETEWMSIAVGKTLAVPGELVSLPRYALSANAVGWRNNNSASRYPTLPAIYANVSGTSVKVNASETETRSDEVWLHPGAGEYAMLSCTVLKEGATSVQLRVTDVNGSSGVGVCCYLAVNGSVLSVVELQNGGAAEFQQYLASLEVGDVVDVILRSRKADGADTQSDATAIGMTLGLASGRVYGDGLANASVTHVACEDFADYNGDVVVTGSSTLILPVGAPAPGDPAGSEQALFSLTDGATLQVEEDWTSGVSRRWDFGSSDDPTIYVAEGKTLRIDGEVTGQCVLHKRGSGTLIMSLAPPGRKMRTLTGEGEIVIEPYDPHKGQTSVKAGWKTIQPIDPSAHADIWRLSGALKEAVSANANPLRTIAGIWSFGTADGGMLDKFCYYSAAPGLKGLQRSDSAGYPCLYVNVTDEPLSRAADELAVAPGEPFVHPGSTDALGLCFGFTAVADATYRISGYVRALNTAWINGNHDGVKLSCYLPGGQDPFASVATTKNGETNSFSCPPVSLLAGQEVRFVVSKGVAYDRDATAFDINVNRVGWHDWRTRPYQEVSLSSNVNMIASWNKGSLPDVSIVNGVAVSFGKTTDLEGGLEPLLRHDESEVLLGWCNAATTTLDKYPTCQLNISGKDAYSTTDYPAHADEWMLHPGPGRYNVCRFKPVAGMQPFDGAIVFQLRDLNPSVTLNPGEAVFILLNGEIVNSALLDKGGTLRIDQDLMQFGPDDTLDFVMRSRYNGGESVSCDLTALSVTLQRKPQTGMVLLLR